MAAPPLQRILPSLALALVACGGGAERAGEDAAAPSPDRVEVEPPTRPLRGAIDNEALSETLDAWLEALGNKVRIRDFDGIATAFAPTFRGEPLFDGMDAGRTDAERLPLGVRRWTPRMTPDGVDRAAFLASIEEHIGPWSRLSQSSWRLVEARFERARAGGDGLVEWGRATVRIHVVGHTVRGSTVVLDAQATARVANVGGEWSLERFRIDRRRFLEHARPMFSEVSRAAGVAYDGLRFGEPGNDADGWGGAAAGDVDGDGCIDVFVPGSQRAFLYRGMPDGTFSEEAESRGLAGLAQGTGAVFFDYDRDGDQDLAVGFVGWRDLTESLAGRPVSVFENDGAGRFRDRTKELGLFDLRTAAYSLTAFDADGDGWTDLFVCGYGRMDEETNDSWLEATNGDRDLFLHNDEGRGFVDRTSAAGLDDTRWSYASAAADFDEDGDLDLYVGNNFGTSRLWRNRGDGTFEDVAAEYGVDVQGNVMGVLWTDLDGDGRLDLYLSSPTSTSGNRLLARVSEDDDRTRRDGALGMMQMANGNKVFLGRGPAPAVGDGPPPPWFERAELGGVRAGWSWSAASPDVDLDGTRDVVCVNGFVTGELAGDT